jgi:hypothetical protein
MTTGASGGVSAESANQLIVRIRAALRKEGTVKTSEQINEIAAALSKAQGAMRPAVKDATNPHFKSKYADLAANVESAREPLATNGLAVIQEATTVAGGVAVVTRLLHASGQWIEFDPMTVPTAKPDAHGIGSATTYARRYALGAALGLVAEDDDGNGAVAPAQQQRREPVVSVPIGFGEWWADMNATADNGAKALKDAWEKSKPEYRRFVAETSKEKWEGLKAKAARVSEAVPA